MVHGLPPILVGVGLWCRWTDTMLITMCPKDSEVCEQPARRPVSNRPSEVAVAAVAVSGVLPRGRASLIFHGLHFIDLSESGSNLKLQTEA